MNNSILDKEIQDIKNIHKKLDYLAGSKNIHRVEISLTGTEINSLHTALGAVITYYEFTKAVENDPNFNTFEQ